MLIVQWSHQILVIALSGLETVRRKFRHSSEKIHSVKYGKYLYSP